MGGGGINLGGGGGFGKKLQKLTIGRGRLFGTLEYKGKYFNEYRIGAGYGDEGSDDSRQTKEMLFISFENNKSKQKLFS